jgi:hypothetical protein
VNNFGKWFTFIIVVLLGIFAAVGATTSTRDWQTQRQQDQTDIGTVYWSCSSSSVGYSLTGGEVICEPKGGYCMKESIARGSLAYLYDLRASEDHETG